MPSCVCPSDLQLSEVYASPACEGAPLLIMHSTGVTFATLMADLEAVPSLLDAQVNCNRNKDEVLASLRQAFVARLESCWPSTSQSAELSQLITAGPWSAEDKAQLAQSLMSDPVPASTPGKRSENAPKHVPPQVCLNFENFLTQNEWIYLRGNNPKVAKSSIIAHRAGRLNFQHPSPATLFRMASVLAYADGRPVVTQEDVSKDMENLKKLCQQQASKHPASYPSLVHFPASASLLPSEV